PYYAMRLVDGETLHDRIDACYKVFPLGTNSSDQSLKFRELLGNIASVCDTVAYAHAKGVSDGIADRGNVTEELAELKALIRRVRAEREDLVAGIDPVVQRFAIHQTHRVIG